MESKADTAAYRPHRATEERQCRELLAALGEGLAFLLLAGVTLASCGTGAHGLALLLGVGHGG